jgi:hypothetical protein
MSGTGSTTFNGALALSGAGTRQVTQRTVNLAGTTTWSAGNFNTGSGAVFNNTGTLLDQNTAAAALSFNLGGAASTFNNTGTYTKSGAGTTTISATLNNSGAGIINVNAGTLALSGLSTISSALDIASGATLDFSAGTHALSGVSAGTGTGTLDISGGTVAASGANGFAGQLAISAGTLNLNGTMNAASYTQSGGTLGGTGALAISGAAIWSGGTMSGAGSTTFNGALALSGTNVKDLSGGRTLSTTGTTTWTNSGFNSAGRIRTGGGVTINNTGAWLDQNLFDTQISNDFGGAASTFVNAGSYTKSGAGNTNILIGFNNSTSGVGTGVVSVNSATLSLGGGGTSNGSFDGTGTLAFGGGTHDLTAASVVASTNVTFSGGTTNLAGSYSVAGTSTVSGGVANFNGTVANTGGNLVVSAGTANFGNTAGVVVSALDLTGGTIAGTQGLTINGASNWSGGTMSGTGSTTFNGTLMLSGTNVKDLSGGRTLNTTGTTTWTNSGFNSAGRIRTGGGVTINNTGAWLDQNLFDTQISNDFGGAASTFVNAGSYTKSGAGNTSIQIGFNNSTSGQVDVSTGIFQVSGLLTQAGTVQVAGGGAIFSKPGGFTNSGVLAGNGIFDMGGGTLVNSGTVRPDGGGADATGTLSVTGGFTQTGTGILDLQAEGTSAGAFDRLAVTGAAVLDGNVMVSTASGFLPGIGQTFDFVTYASATGSFSTIVSPGFPGLAAAYGATSAVFSVQSGCPVDDCWVGGSGDWSTGSNWSTGAVPSTGQRVRISVAGNQTVTLTTGSFNLLDIDSDENIALAGGALSVSGLFGMAAGTTLGISGGALTVNGSLNAPIVNLSAGSLGGAGNITVSTDFNQTGGNFNPTGNLDLVRSMGDFTLAALSTNGTIRLATLGLNDMTLTGSLQATNSGLANALPAITVTSGRDIRIASTASLTTVTSGAISLVAGRDVNLKVSDGGASGANNTIAAVGNLNVTANSGQIVKTDGDPLSLSAANIALSAGTSIGAFDGAITASAGNVALNANGAVAFTAINAAGPTGSININSTAASITGGTLSAGRDVLLGLSTGSGISVGSITAGSGGNGTIAITNSGASDITLNGSLQATNTGLADNAPAISIVSGRDILLASTTDLVANTSGAIVLNAAGAVNLKVDDGGGSGANNAISAAGNLAITAGTSISRTDGNIVNLAGKAVTLDAGTSIGSAGGSIVASAGNLALNAASSITVDTLISTVGAIDINGGSAVSAAALSAGTSVFVDGTGTLSLGTLNAANGVVNLTAAGVASDIVLGGGVTATNTGLLPTQAGISANAGRDILVASTTDLATLGSGGITLSAGRDVNLKVSDGGGSAANNTIAAVGNLNIVATSGQIFKTDGNVLSASAQGIDLTYATALDPTLVFVPVTALDITRTSGDLIASSFSGPLLNLNAPGGNVVFAAGSTFSGGTVTTSGAGNTVFNAGVVSFNSTLASALPLSIGGASVAFNAATTAPALAMGSGSATFAQATTLTDINLTGGTLTIHGGVAQLIAGGTWDVGAGSALNLPAPGGSITAGATLNVSGGSVNYGAGLAVAGNLGLSSGSLAGTGPIAVDVAGTISKTGAGTFTVATILNNGGSVNTTAGALSLNGGGAHTGTFTAESGSTLAFQGGTHTFLNGAVLAGPGVFDGGGALNLSGSTSGLTVAADATVNLNALAFGGSGALTNLGTASGSGVGLPGDFTNAAGATANLTNVTIGGSLFNYGNFNTGGTVTVAGLQGQQLGGVLSIPSGATLNMASPSGVFSWQDGTIGGTGTLGFPGGGTFLFAGVGDRVIDGLNFAFNNLTLPDGSLTLRSGSLTLAGTTVLPAGVALNLVGGALTNNGTLDVGGAFSLTGGAFGGTGSLTLSGGNLSLPSNNSVAWTNSGTLTNTGTLNLASSTITNAIDNQGTVNLGGGLTFTQQLTNTGTVHAQSGNAVFANGLVQNAGDLVLEGGTLQGNVDLNAGSIRGTGTVNGSVTVGNATMAPGFSPGSLDITGDLTLGPSSVLNIELGGLTRGTGFDAINVQGTAYLGGTLNVLQVGGFVAPAGSSFAFMSATNRSGAFSAVNLPPPIQFDSSSLLLSVPGPVFTPETLLIADPVSIATQRILPMEELIAELGVMAPSPPTDTEREIELEGCR